MSISKSQAGVLVFAAAFAIGAWASAAHADPKTLAKVDALLVFCVLDRCHWVIPGTRGGR